MTIHQSCVYLYSYYYLTKVVLPDTTGNIRELETEIELRVGSGWSDDREDYPLRYQFGVKTELENSPQRRERWFPPSSVDQLLIRLPSGIQFLSPEIPPFEKFYT